MQTAPSVSAAVCATPHSGQSARRSWREAFAARRAIRRRNRTTLRELFRMDDWQLDDIGLSREAVHLAYLAGTGPFAPPAGESRL